MCISGMLRPDFDAPHLTIFTPCHLLQGGYNHFMEKEIFEQHETITQTMQVGGAGEEGPAPYAPCAAHRCAALHSPPF